MYHHTAQSQYSFHEAFLRSRPDLTPLIKRLEKVGKRMDVDSEPDFYEMPFLPDWNHPDRGVIGPAGCLPASLLPNHQGTTSNFPQIQVQLQDAFNQYALQMHGHSRDDAASTSIPPANNTLPMFNTQLEQQDASRCVNAGRGEVSSYLDQKPAAQSTLTNSDPRWNTSDIGNILNSAQGQNTPGTSNQTIREELPTRNSPDAMNQTTRGQTTSIPNQISATQSEAASSVLDWNLGRSAGCFPNNPQIMHPPLPLALPNNVTSNECDSIGSNHQFKQHFVGASFPDNDVPTNTTSCNAFSSNHATSSNVLPGPIASQAPESQSTTTTAINQQSIALLSNPPNHPILEEFAEHYLPFFGNSSGESGNSDE
jgi:hypothetical protein